jgi:hypothetical protein
MRLYLSIVLLFVGRYLSEAGISHRGGQLLLLGSMAAVLPVLFVRRAGNSAPAHGSGTFMAVTAIFTLIFVVRQRDLALEESTPISIWIPPLAIVASWLAASVYSPKELGWRFAVSPVSAALLTISLLGLFLGKLGAPSVIEGIEATGLAYTDKAREGLPIIYGVVPGSTIAGLGAAGFLPLLFEGAWRRRLFGLGAIVAGAAVIYATGTRGGFALILTSATVYFACTRILKPAQHRWLPIALILPPVLAPTLLPPLLPLLQQVVGSMGLDAMLRGNESSLFDLTGRPGGWAIALENVFQPRLLFQWPVAFGEQFAGVSFDIAANFNVEKVETLLRMHAHNTPLNALYGGGLLCVICYLSAIRRAINGCLGPTGIVSKSTFSLILGWISISTIESLLNMSHPFFHYIFLGILAESWAAGTLTEQPLAASVNIKDIKATGTFAQMRA